MGGTTAAAALELVRDTGLTGLIRRGSEHTLQEAGSERRLPMLPELAAVLPGGGLRRGSTVSISTAATAATAIEEPTSAATVHRLDASRTRTGSAQSGVPGALPGSGSPALPGSGAQTLSRASGPRQAVAPPAGQRAISAPAGQRAAGQRASSPPTPAVAATSLLLALLAEPSRAGSWCAVVGVPTLGAAAAAELGIALDRLVLVPHPGPDWPTVVAALLDGFDIVAAAAPGTVAPTVAGRLAARARQRGSVFVPFGAWPGADLTLEATDPRWHGIEAGRGRLRGRQLTVVVRGRGAAALDRHTYLWLPRPTGLMVAEPDESAHDAPALLDGQPVDTGPLATIHPLRVAEAAS